MTKTFEVSYRKRGLPESPLQITEIEAGSFPEAKYKAQVQVGEEYIINTVRTKKEEKQSDI